MNYLKSDDLITGSFPLFTAGFFLFFFLVSFGSFGQNFGSKGKTYAVVVGISDYQDEAIPDLKFAHKDAEAFADYLRSPAGGSLDEDHLTLLINEEATMAQFAIALDALMEKAKENDQVLIYFSGHGDVEKKTITQPGFLLCWDSPAKVYMAGGTFPLPFLQEIVTTLSVQNKAKVVVITDACRSGKLAGSSVGGAEITGSNLSKQYANEIKILSCQPDEFSMEGEQWGGGRGAFSYHLMDALYGLADNNEDLVVTLMEVGRYLEDKVITEVSPQSQVPITVGNRTEKMAYVSEDVLAKLKKSKENNQAVFSFVESRGLEEEVLKTVDEATRVLYAAFKKSLKDKIFLEPTEACAEAYFSELIKEPKLEKLYSSMKRSYAAALQDDAQQVLNRLLDFDPKICFMNRDDFVKNYSTYPRLIERSIELLGEDHYMFNTLKARQLWFEGYLNDLGVNEFEEEDLKKAARSKFKQALEYLPEMPQAYLALGKSFIFDNQLDSAKHYLLKAKESAPGWIYPYTALYLNEEVNGDAREGGKWLDKAWTIDSTQIVLLNSRYKYFNIINQPKAAIRMLERALEQDSTVYCSWINLSVYYMDFPGDEGLLKAKHAIEKAYEINDSDYRVLLNMAIIKSRTGYPEESISYLERLIEVDSSFTLAYIVWAVTLQNLERYDESEQMFFRAIEMDPQMFQSYVNLGILYAHQSRFEEADAMFEKSISLSPVKPQMSDYIGGNFFDSKQFDLAKKYFNLCIEYGGNHGNARYMLATIEMQDKQTERAIALLSQAFENGMLDKDRLLQDPVFKELQERDDFKNLIQKYFPEQNKK